jgi:hypothetical protein
MIRCKCQHEQIGGVPNPYVETLRKKGDIALLFYLSQRINTVIVLLGLDYLFVDIMTSFVAAAAVAF